MPKWRVTLDDGSTYDVEAEQEPTKDEVVSFLNQGTADFSGIGGLEPETPFRSPIRADFSALAGGEGLGMELPSPAELLEFLPDVTGAAGALAGGTVGHPMKGGVAGSAVGEVGRQLIRSMVGEKPATGVVQEMLDLDPEGLPAKALGVGSEAASAAGFEALGKILGKGAAPALKKRGVSLFADLAEPTSQREKREIIRRIMPIAEDLPAGTRGRVSRKTEESLDEFIQKQKSLMEEFGDEPIRTPTGDDALGRARGELTEEIEKNIQSRAGVATEAMPLNRKLDKALNKRIAELEERSLAREGSEQGPFSAKEILAMRQQADREALQAQAKVMAPGKSARDISDRAQAALKERGAFKRQLHDPEAWSQADEMMKTDEGIAAWATINEAVQNENASHFLARWGMSRLIGGMPGTIMGLGAGAPTFLKTIRGKTWINIGRLLAAGEEAQAEYLLRSQLRDTEREDE